MFEKINWCYSIYPYQVYFVYTCSNFWKSWASVHFFTKDLYFKRGVYAYPLYLKLR